jgi:predicted NBD/HSP70 family sugar kinase
MASRIWGLDLGGTKIEGVVLEPDRSSEPICRLRVPTEAAQGYRHILDQIRHLLERMEAETGSRRPERIGMGTPGTEDPRTGRMKNCNTTALNGQPLRADLEAILETEVRLANDANCFALAEARLGAAKGHKVVFGVIMGTGVGGGLVVDGHVLGGAHGIAGEWGHNVLEPDGDPCYCGKVGCVETVLAGPSLERFYERRSGQRKGMREILAKVAEDSAALATEARLVEGFGRALSVVVNIVDPDAIVLGGGVGHAAALYERGKESLSRWMFNERFEGALLRPMLGDSAGVFGAAMLVNED